MPEPIPILFGRVVRQRREAIAMSQETLGAETELSRNYIGMIERGETNPTLLVLHSLSIALQTTMSALIQELEAALAPPAGS